MELNKDSIWNNSWDNPNENKDNSWNNSTKVENQIFQADSKIFNLNNSWKNSEWKLFAILLEKKLSEDSKIFDWVKKYAEEIQKKFPQYSSKIYLIDEKENQNSIYSKLEYLYFNWEKNEIKKIF